MPKSLSRCVASLVACLLFAHAALGQTLAPLGPLDDGGVVTFVIEPGDAASEYRPGDRELAEWALRAWENAADGALEFEPTTGDDPLLRIRFVPAGAGLYGEMRPAFVAGRRGAVVYVRPDTDALGPDIAALARADELFRDTVVYLTCVHEIGHALGLAHTDAFADIMYFFGFGGDIPAFFGRFRAQLESRADIPAASALSAADIERLRELYPRN